MHRQIVEDVYELSPLQQGMLFHTLLEPEARLYFEQILLSGPAGVDADAFERAWASVAASQSVLRTAFHWQEADKPLQVVHRQVSIPIERHSLKGLDPAGQAEEVARLLSLDRERGFDLGRPPLFRVAILDCGPSDQRLLFSFHHLILDGWSLQLLFRQFSDAYHAFLEGRHPARPATRPYRDYVQWLQTRGPLDAQRYWRRTFEGYDGQPAIWPRPGKAAGPDDFSEREIYLDASIAETYRSAAARHRLTLNTVVQGAWALLLNRTGGTDDVVFGVVASGRPPDLTGVEQMIGLFINTVPLRVRIGHGEPVLDWLQAMQARQFEARRYDFTPLVQIGQWIGRPAREPLFDSIIGFENYPMGVSAAQGAVSATFIERTNYPLTAVVVPGERLHIKLLHDRRVIDGSTAEALLHEFRFILDSLAACLEQAPTTAIDALPRQSPVDIENLRTFNRRRTDHPEANLVQLFEARVDECPEAPAIEWQDVRQTYGALDHAANRLAHRLRTLGVGPGDTVGLLFEPSAELVTAMLAVLKAGACYVPLDVDQPLARQERVLAETGPRCIVGAPSRCAGLRGSGLDVLCLGEGAEEPDDVPAVRLPCRGIAEDVAYVMHTSGSTGRPKGIAISHRAIVRLVSGADYITVNPADRIAHHSNPAFDATTFEVWGALLNGATLVGLSRDAILDPRELGLKLKRLDISVLFLTTAILNQSVLEDADSFATLRVLLFGGENADPGIVRRLATPPTAGEILHVYGPTESTTFATAWRVAADHDGPVPIGRPIANRTAYVLDAEMRPVPPGGVGELYLGGDGLAHFYVGAPAETASRFVPDPFGDRPGRLYRTGDRVRRRGDGALEFAGRLDRQIKLRGFRIEPGEIEHVATQVPEVRQAVAMDRRNDIGDHEIRLYVDSASVDRQGLHDRLVQHLREQLPPYMMPTSIALVEGLPLNGNGKVDRSKLLDLATPIVAPGSRTAPRSEVETALRAIWKHVLDAPEVGVHDNFFELGGHSLRATQIVSRIRRELAVDLPLRAIFEAPTIAGLAALIEASGYTRSSEENAAVATPSGASAAAPAIRPVNRDRYADRGE